MKQVPDAMRTRLAAIPICRANGISPRVLIPEEALDWLKNVDLRDGEIDLCDDLAERVVSFGNRFLGAPYRVHAAIQDAPAAFSCSTFAKYCFASVGIWLPRYAIDQSYCGVPYVGNAWPIGSLVFWKSRFPIHDPSRSVGHVGIACDDGLTLHAGGEDRTVHRFAPKRPDTATVINPFPSGPHALLHLPLKQRALETALDAVRWMQRPP